jgi:hypothetical protein
MMTKRTMVRLARAPMMEVTTVTMVRMVGLQEEGGGGRETLRESLQSCIALRESAAG